jgi:hypothetical protein
MAITPNDVPFDYSTEEREQMAKFTNNAELTAWLRSNRDDTLIESGQFQRDAFSPDILIANPNAPAPEQPHELSVTIKDKEGNAIIIEAETQEELSQKLYAATHVQAPPTAEEVAENAKYQGTWEAATHKFLEAHSDFERCQANLESMQDALVALGLTEKPTAESMEAAFAYMVQHEQYFESPSTTLEREVAEATSHEGIRRLVRPDFDERYATRN